MDQLKSPNDLTLPPRTDSAEHHPYVFRQRSFEVSRMTQSLGRGEARCLCRHRRQQRAKAPQVDRGAVRWQVMGSCPRPEVQVQ